ncbi:MAG TPA: ATP-binding protein, partial [Rhodopila sp.]|nr:ATP-binding protein [Rhodopila sp.]
DGGQLEIALINLVRNAREAMPDGGSMLIQTRSVVVDGQPAVDLIVKDPGTGMSPEVARRAVEPFFTTKPQGASTGLGLSMVNGFVAQSGGKMLIASEPEHGTTVTLRFPTQQRATGAP